MSDIITILRERGLTVEEAGREESGILVSIKAGPEPTAAAAEQAWLAKFDLLWPGASGTVYWHPGRLPGFPEIKQLSARKAAGNPRDEIGPGWYAYGRCVVVP